MNDEKHLPRIIYFSAVERDKVEEPTVASALQSIETALQLIASDKWPTVIALLFEAAEKLLKTIVGSKYENKDKEKQERRRRSENQASKLIERYANKYKLSEAEKVDANNFRERRNNIAHSGYSPRDDRVIIKQVFQVAIPFLDKIFNTKFQTEVFELIEKSSNQAWVADAYKKTAEVIGRKAKIEDDNFVAALLPLQLAFGRIARTESANKYITEGNSLEALLEEKFQDFSYTLKGKLYFQFLEDMKFNIKHINYSALLSIPDEICLKCHEERIIGAVTFDDAYKFLRVDAFGCCHCEWSIWDQEVCDVFINEVLEPEQKAVLENYDGITAEDYPPYTL